MNTLKIHEVLSELVHQKKEGFEQLILDLRKSNNETKSSMGDKYETSREMVQQEINRLQSQLKVTEEQVQILKHLKTDTSLKVELGTLVETNTGLFYISVSHGKFSVDNKTIFAISEESPLAKVMMGLQEGDSFKLNDQEQLVKNIW